MDIAPGNILTILKTSRNSSLLNQLYFWTTSFSINGKNEYAPPTAKKPTFKKDRNNFNKIIFKPLGVGGKVVFEQGVRKFLWLGRRAKARRTKIFSEGGLPLGQGARPCENGT